METNAIVPFEPMTISALQATMVAAIAKHGDRTPLNPTMSDPDKLIILIEEVGEVARAMTYDEGSANQLVKELLQTAAMALAFAQSKDVGSDYQPRHAKVTEFPRLF